MKESPIFVKTQIFTVWLLERTERFRKTQRFVMGKRIQDAALDFQEAITTAANKSNPKDILNRANIKLDILRRHIRTCVDLKLFSIRQYEFASQNLVEIGRLLGGWRKKYNTNYRLEKAETGSDSDNSPPCVAGRVVEQQPEELPISQSQQEQS